MVLVGGGGAWMGFGRRAEQRRHHSPPVWMVPARRVRRARAGLGRGARRSEDAVAGSSGSPRTVGHAQLPEHPWGFALAAQDTVGHAAVGTLMGCAQQSGLPVGTRAAGAQRRSASGPTPCVSCSQVELDVAVGTASIARAWSLDRVVRNSSSVVLASTGLPSHDDDVAIWRTTARSCDGLGRTGPAVPAGRSEQVQDLCTGTSNADGFVQDGDLGLRREGAGYGRYGAGRRKFVRGPAAHGAARQGYHVEQLGGAFVTASSG